MIFIIFFQVDHTYKLYYGGAQKRPDGNYVNIIRNVEGKHVAEVGQANRKGIFYAGKILPYLQISHIFLMANFAILQEFKILVKLKFSEKATISLLVLTIYGLLKI